MEGGPLWMDTNREADSSKNFLDACELLKDKGTLLDTVMQSMGDGLSIQDPDMRIVFQNKFMVDNFGMHRGEYCFRIYERRNEICEGCPIVDAYSDGKVHKALRVGITREGAPFRFENTASVLRDSEGRIVAGMELCRIVEDREKFREELQKSEERFKQIAENAQEWIWEVDSNGLYTYGSPIVEEILGYRLEEIIGKKHFYDLFHPEDLEELKKAAFEVFAQKRPFRELINRNVRKNGKIIYLSTSGTPILDERGELLGYRGADTDITERKRAEEEIRLIIDSSPLIIFYKDKEGRFIRVNRVFARALQMSEEDFVGKTVFDLYSPEIAKRMTDDDQEVLHSGLPKVNIIESYESANGIRWVQTDKIPICDKKGIPIGLIGFTRDITEHRRAEAKLGESEERFKRFFENMPAYCYMVSPESTIQDVNRSALQRLGYEKEELIGQPMAIIYAPESHDKMRQLFSRRVETGHIENEEMTIITRDGSRREVLLSSNMVCDQDGNLLHSTSVQWDVTEQKKLEEQLRQAQKMEAIGRLAGGVAHDFNNILMAILGHGELILSDLAEADPLRQDVLQIRECAQRAATLTRQLLTFSRKQVLQPGNLDLNAIVLGMDRMLRRIIGEDVELHTVLAPELGIIRADPGQVEQVILNIVVNSRDAMPRGGRLTIETAEVELGEEYVSAQVSPGRYVMLAISDTGCGIEKEIQDNIFEPFFTTKEVGKGTGLGLAAVYGIVKQAAGHIQVDSEAGAGTTIRIYLPIVNEPAEEVATRKDPGMIKNVKDTILVVEDDKTIRQLIVRILTGAGYTVLEAGNGNEALIVCQQQKGPIALVVSDVVMPEMSGRELAESLKDLCPGMRVLFMSGYTDDAITRHGIVENQVPFLPKPFTSADLRNKIRAILDA